MKDRPPTTRELNPNHAPTWATNPHLSLKAKGLLTLIATKPTGFSVTELLTLSRDGRDATRTAIDELLEAGYITRHDGRDEHERFTGVIYRPATPER